MIKKTAFFLASIALPLAAANAQADQAATQPAQDQLPTDTATDQGMTGQMQTDPSSGAGTASTGTPAGGTTDGGAISAATSADFTTGATVRDPLGGTVGTVESATAGGVVISTGAHRVQLPAASFGKNAQGLVISLSKAELDAQASAAAQKPQQ